MKNQHNSKRRRSLLLLVIGITFGTTLYWTTGLQENSVTTSINQNVNASKLLTAHRPNPKFDNDVPAVQSSIMDEALCEVEPEISVFVVEDNFAIEEPTDEVFKWYSVESPAASTNQSQGVVSHGSARMASYEVQSESAPMMDVVRVTSRKRSKRIRGIRRSKGNKRIKGSKRMARTSKKQNKKARKQYVTPVKSEESSEQYNSLVEGKFISPKDEPLSTFGIDTDNASYTIMRNKITSGSTVPKDAVRIEEFINYFDYNYSSSDDSEHPFAVDLELAECPWDTTHKIARIGIQGKDLREEEINASNLVFLIDVSGSMSSYNKLPMVKESLKMLVDQLADIDKIAIVTYSTTIEVALSSTSCADRNTIKSSIDKLQAGGSTAGGPGIKMAYEIAEKNFIDDGNNRVILCTDGDFNVGLSSDYAMKELISKYREKNIFITACGVGMGNLKDGKLETIADNGNGSYFYLDNFKESERVFKRDLQSTMFTVAKDVKIQVEFNPKHVKAYRLIGYENRIIPAEDFKNDSKDGGEVGAGHTVTALYEVIPATEKIQMPPNADLKYQKTTETGNNYGHEIMSVKLRYKEPKGFISTLVKTSLDASDTKFEYASEDFRFAVGVALFAQQLRQSSFVKQDGFQLAMSIVKQSMTVDEYGAKEELLQLMAASKVIYTRSFGQVDQR